MANPYKATLRGAADDGTNTYLMVEVSNGTQTMQPFQLTVPTGTAAANITALLQSIANNQPTVAAGIGSLINSSVLGV